jgi:5-methylcytosine-specific restriction endonuclease McrA
MKHHTKIWLKSRGLYQPNMMAEDFNMLCEFRGDGYVVDVNHIHPRGMGGSKTKDTPENLIGLCRKCHDEFEAKKISKEKMREAVDKILQI